MKNKSLIIIFLLTVIVSHAQHSFFRGTNNYVAPTPVASSQANALNFSSSLLNYAFLPPATYFSGDFTIECWVKPTAYSNWSRVIDFGNGAGSNNVLFGTSYGGSGKPGFYVGGSQFSANDQIPLNQWSHIAATLSGNTATIYINGVASGTSFFPIPANVIRNNNYIGRSNWGWGDPAPDASFDDLRIWNVAKTDAEILASMNNELIGNESGLVAYFKFNEGVPCGNNTAITTLVNSATLTGSAYNATLTGFTLNGSCVSNFVTGKVANTAATITNGLVLNLDASNPISYPGTGTTWFDLSGSNNNGILVNNPVYNSTNGGNIEFNGSNTYIDVSLTKTASCTFSAWAKSTDTNSNNMLFNAGYDGSGPDLFFSGGVLSWNTWDSSNNPFGSIPATSANGNWHNYVLVNDEVSNTAKLYYDGVLYGTAAYRNASANTVLYIGGNSNAYMWNGAIGNFQVFNRSLISSEVLQNFNAVKSRFGL